MPVICPLFNRSQAKKHFIRRFKLLLVACVALVQGFRCIAEQVVISEIMYHPAGSKPAWIEIENRSATPLDIAGWTVSGKEMRYQFPAFTATAPAQSFLNPFERIVVTSVSPDSFKTAFQTPEGTRILGPWSGQLKRSKDQLTVRDKNGGYRCRVSYQDGGNWPILADGTGHSLVLTNQHRPIDNWRNWTASLQPSGTPGAPEPDAQTNRNTSSLAFLSEIHFDEGGTLDWVELVHSGGTPFPSRSLIVSSSRDLSTGARNEEPLDSTHPRVVIPTRFREPRARGAIRLYLATASGQFLDARDFDILSGAGSWQRTAPDKEGDWHHGSAPTRGLPNARIKPPGIILNEVFYNPPTGSGTPEFVELFNRGQEIVDLGGWSLSGGVEFTFPEKFTLQPGSYLAITSDVEKLKLAYPRILLLGNFKGKLGNQGDRLLLRDKLGNPVDTVDYLSTPNWPAMAGGEGSSMEREHPFSDATLPSAWSSSNESSKSSFKRFEASGIYAGQDPLGKTTDYRELHLNLAEAGHLVLANIQLIETRTGRNHIPPGARESVRGTGKDGWLIQGNHATSHWVGDELHLISTGHGDNRANRIEIDVPHLKPGTPCTLTFEARWISGSPRIIAQTWDHSLAFSFEVPIPPNLGTPGGRNSVAAEYPVPQPDQLSHLPLVPNPSETVRFRVRVTSTEPPLRILLMHRKDSKSGRVPWTATPLHPAPTAASPSETHSVEYTADIPAGATPGDILQFFVQAEGREGTIRFLPREGAGKPALLVVDTNRPTSRLRTERFIVSARDLDSIANGGGAAFGFRHPKLSNAYLNASLVSSENGSWHNIEIRRSGSAWNRGDSLSRGKWKTPAGEPFRGRHKWVFDNDPAGSRRYSDRMARYLLYLLGHPASDSEFIRVIINAGPVELREEIEPVDLAFIRRWFEDDPVGELYRIDDEWWFKDDWTARSRDASWMFKGTHAPGRYRSEWMKRSRENQDDFSSLTAFFEAISKKPPAAEDIAGRLDVQSLMKLAAVNGYVANWDTFTMSRGKNGYFYRRNSDHKFQMLHWDSDAAFENDPQTEPFYGSHQPFAQWMEDPANRRIFIRELDRIVKEFSEGSPRMRAWMEAQNAVSPETAIDIGRFEKWFRDRNAAVRRLPGFSSP